MRGRIKSILTCRNIKRFSTWWPGRTLAGALMPLLYRGRQLFGTRDSAPLGDKFAFLSEHENAKVRRSLGLAKLRRRRPIKIDHHKNVLLRVTLNSLRIIPGLEADCCFGNKVPSENSNEPLPDHTMSSRKANNCDHPVIRITQATFWNAVTNGTRLVPVSRCGQRDNGHMSVSCGKLASINIDKTKRVGCSHRKGSV